MIHQCGNHPASRHGPAQPPGDEFTLGPVSDAPRRPDRVLRGDKETPHSATGGRGAGTSQRPWAARCVGKSSAKSLNSGENAQAYRGRAWPLGRAASRENTVGARLTPDRIPTGLRPAPTRREDVPGPISAPRARAPDGGRGNRAPHLRPAEGARQVRSGVMNCHKCKVT
jgi:hypothetical protein